MTRPFAVLFALLVMAVGLLGHGAEVKVEGVLKGVDAKARSLTVERTTATGKKELSLEVAEEAGDISSLKVGGEVSLIYDSTLELVTKIPAPVVNGAGARPGKVTDKQVCRVTLHVASDGTSSGRIESAPDEPASDDGIGVPKKVAEGLWQVVHTFPNEASCKPYRRLLERNMMNYSTLHKALVLPPAEMINGWATLSFPCLLRLPVTVVADVEAVGKNAQVAVALHGRPTPTSIQKSIEAKVVTEDGFRTNEFTGLFNTRNFRQSPMPSTEEVFVERGVSLGKGAAYQGKRDPTMDFGPTSQWSATCSSVIGPEKRWQGVRVKRFEVKARLAPVLGVQMEEDSDGVFVVQVVPDALASKAGLKAGDRVVSVGGKQVSGLARTMQLLQVTEFGDTWDLEIVRDGSKKTFSIKAELP